MVNKKAIIFFVPVGFLLASVTVATPTIKDAVIATAEFVAELFLLVDLVILFLHSRKRKPFYWDIILLNISILFLFSADTIYSARLIKITAHYGFFADCMYTGFATFLLLFLLNKLNIYKRNFHEWGWVFIVIFIVDSVLSYNYLLLPYYKFSNDSLPWKINATIYMTLSISIFSLVLPFAFRASNRIIFWFLNFILLLLVADFAIRYQDAFIDTSTFSWAELAWCSSFIGLAYLFYSPKNKKELFITRCYSLSPFISIRSLLTLFIGGANSLLLFSMLCINLYSFHTAVDISSTLLLLFLFWTIANEFAIWVANDLGRLLKYMFKSKENLTDGGLIQINLERVIANTPIFEVSKILESYNDLVDQTNKMLDMVAQTNKNTSIAEIASQVSHDIRSPLVALDMVIKDLSELPEEKRILIRSSIGRIKDIANNLCQNNMKNLPLIINVPETTISDDSKSIQLLSSLIDILISEKRMQFRAKINVEIDSKLDENAYGIFSEINTREFMRLLSNLINNAVEALGESGRVIVSLTQVKNYAVLSIVDNGCGISHNLLKGLGSKGKTYGKKDGLGLGLYHAKQTVESWNGYLTIDSTPNVGTSVSIMLPLAKASIWFVEQLNIAPNSTIVILDDDVSIHQIWDDRFEKAHLKQINVKILHFSTPDQLTIWVKDNRNKQHNILFLIDYELIGFKTVGLDLIENLDICSQSILITSHYDEVELRTRCEHLGVQLIPKSVAAYVPIITEIKSNLDAILIDDDYLIQICWQKSAEANKKTIAVFSTLEDFFAEAKKFEKSTAIYLDVSLANGIRGDIAAKKVFGMGFFNIYLATGYEPDKFVGNPYIKGVVDKYPPFFKQ